MGWYYNSYPQRKSAAEIKADAKRNIKKDYHPVAMPGAGTSISMLTR